MKSAKSAIPQYTQCEAIIPARSYDKSNITLNPVYEHLLFIIYDGITNSVFTSQVLQPLLQLLKANNTLEITLISFEKNRPLNKTLQEVIPAHDRLHLILGHRLPFFGKASLHYSAYGLAKIIAHIPCNKVIARGPLAGWITLHALAKLKRKKNFALNQTNPDGISSFIIQARGLAAEEYRFMTQFNPKNFLQQYFQKFRYQQLLAIEQEVYNKKASNLIGFQVRIESVSNALSDYLCKTFHTSSTQLFLAKNDIPHPIPQETITRWKHEIRQNLGIPESAFVFVYSGSAKPWQCVRETIFYFQEQYKKDPKSFLLILSNETEAFENICKATNLNESIYRVISVSPETVYTYLAAADVGMLFRHTDIINWVSRPTKALEYEAVKLPIVHNDTVAWLIEKSKKE